jgi:hypothetical protein
MKKVGHYDVNEAAAASNAQNSKAAGIVEHSCGEVQSFSARRSSCLPTMEQQFQIGLRTLIETLLVPAVIAFVVSHFITVGLVDGRERSGRVSLPLHSSEQALFSPREP